MDSAGSFIEVDPSASVPDWSREHKSFWSWMPSRSLLASIRAYQRISGSSRPWHALHRRWLVLTHRFWSVVTGADIALSCRIAGGLLLPPPERHRHPNDVEIGPNCLIFSR
jgi:serine O-acetyltransferase